MLDILEIAEEKGMEKGREKGRAEATREIILDLLIERFEVLPPRISDQIRAIENSDTLKALLRLISKCSDIDEYEQKLARINSGPF